MKTGNQIVKEILEFYENIKEGIVNVELDGNEYIIDESRIVHITYYYEGTDYLMDQVRVMICWDEIDAHFNKKDEDHNIIAKIDTQSNHLMFDDDELEFFDKLGFRITDEANRDTKQSVEDWF